jgi:hypothetical protein
VLTNEHVKDSLRKLADLASDAEGALANSDDLPPEDLAECFVVLGKLREKTAKLADRINKLAAPLFAARPAGQDETPPPAGNGPAGGRKKGKVS